MKAVISTTYSHTYLYFLPICVWAWNRLGVDVICFAPINRHPYECYNGDLVLQTLRKNNLRCEMQWFSAPEHKEATYAQTARLFAGCLDLPKNDSPIITSDCDMLVFNDYIKQYPGDITTFGADLLEGEKMYPICYCSMTLNTWREVMDIGNKTLQECLDEQFGEIETENFRGNYWCFDQNLLYNKIKKSTRPVNNFNRAKKPENFATRRYDRDDQFILDRLSPDTIDFHMPRPGYEDRNFEIILTILKYHYPQDDFQWLINYTNAYKQLL